MRVCNQGVKWVSVETILLTHLISRITLLFAFSYPCHIRLVNYWKKAHHTWFGMNEWTSFLCFSCIICIMCESFFFPHLPFVCCYLYFAYFLKEDLEGEMIIVHSTYFVSWMCTCVLIPCVYRKSEKSDLTSIGPVFLNPQTHSINSIIMS